MTAVNKGINNAHQKNIITLWETTNSAPRYFGHKTHYSNNQTITKKTEIQKQLIVLTNFDHNSF